MRCSVVCLLVAVSLNVSWAANGPVQFRSELKTYDEQGRLVAATDESGRHWRFVDDPDGTRRTWVGSMLSAEERPDGTVIAHAYDERGTRVQTRITKPGTKTQYIDYTSAGEPVAPPAKRREHAVQPQPVARPAQESIADVEERGAAVLRGILGDSTHSVRRFASKSTPAGPQAHQALTALPTIASAGRWGALPPGPGASNASPQRVAALTTVGIAPAPASASTSYTWDDNGNLTATSDGTTFVWDTENRLIQVAKGDGTRIEHAYDVDGNRVQTKVTQPGQPTETTHYLVDPTGLVPQVVAETNGAGELTAFVSVRRATCGEALQG
ncbi:hypothetical protein P2318_25310 [Myxococcaceae bacterium GXIMD 01537]